MKKKSYILIIIFFMLSYSCSIGWKGNIIPENGYVLATCKSGIAEGISPSLNPALKINPKSYIQFSFNNWISKPIPLGQLRINNPPSVSTFLSCRRNSVGENKCSITSKFTITSNF